MARAAATVLLVCRCGPPRTLDLPPDPAETERLLALVHAPPRTAWSGRGHAQVASPDGDFEGTLQARLDPPHRARVEVAARALFGMVGDRLVWSLPGDGNVLFYRERGDRLERAPFAASELARWTGCASPGQLFELAAGRPPWPGGSPPPDLNARARVVERADRGRVVRYRVALPDSGWVFDLRLGDGVLERFEWWEKGAERLEVRYDRWMTLEAARQPTRVRLRAPQDQVEAEFTLDSLELRLDFTAQDFEVY